MHPICCIYPCCNDMLSIVTVPPKPLLQCYHNCIHSTAPCCWLYWICASTNLFFLVSMLPYQPPCHFHDIQCTSYTSTTTIVTVLLILYPLHYEYYAVSTTKPTTVFFCLCYHINNPVLIVSYLFPSLLNLKLCCIHFNMPLTHHCCY